VGGSVLRAVGLEFAHHGVELSHDRSGEAGGAQAAGDFRVPVDRTGASRGESTPHGFGELRAFEIREQRARQVYAHRRDDPMRARQLLESAVRTYPGSALAELSDMLIKGDGGPKDEKRALSLLQRSPYDAQHAKWALGQLTLEGRLVRRDVAQAVKLLGPWSQWDYDTRLQIVRLLAENPNVQMEYADHYLYRTIEDAELGEPGAVDALIALKLSRHVQFADKAGGCALAERAGKRLDECRAK